MKFGAVLALLAYALPAVVGLPSMDAQQVLSMEDDVSTYEHVSHPAFAEYSLRLKKPTLCDDSVKQYSGYLDIAEDKHLFFWFFESRGSPSDDPLVMWLNGGPGCSSTTGLLFELGPCTINKTEDGTVFTSHNPHSWNQNANVIFLDQPAMVGYSYSSNKTAPVKTTPEAAKDVYAFLQLFVRRFDEYATRPFHIAAESYGGHYAPNIASIVHRKNKELIQAPSSDLLRINLQSIMLGNALTDPLIQMPSVVGYACDGPFAVFDRNSKECHTLRRRAPICERLIKTCYALDNRASCMPATVFCWGALWGVLDGANRNFYDVRMPCNRTENPLCYEEIDWVENYMNLPEVKKALGVDPRAPEYTACNMEMNQDFALQGDGMRNTKKLLTEIVDEGIRLLVYAGNVDMMCNYMGEAQWIEQLPSTHKDAFGEAPFLPWTVSDRPAGVVRSVGKGAGNITYLTVYEAGHMVPHDQPEAALDMLNKWIRNIPLAD
ncbi:serine carboxypeptidase [Mycena alexandri]|uniref:Carboxypeptidase n=1 Tax=Mycena alexandri TaxID=1745969 RepID=A0AAD6WPN4_9AGAR|nr:serine carboxypeptidase [Mycena alexandri]